MHRTVARSLAAPFVLPAALDSADPDRPTLARQVPIPEDRIDARAREGVPFVAPGDFDRRFDVRGDEVFPETDDAEPSGLALVPTTEGVIPACPDGRFPEYVDPIALGARAARFLVQGSFRPIPITEAMFALSGRLPIAMGPALTDGPDPDPRARAGALFEDIRDLARETDEKVGELERPIPALA
ncbi:MAG: hypothetical protein ACFBWO_17550 [Paracoccaceae bacterium]